MLSNISRRCISTSRAFLASFHDFSVKSIDGQTVDLGKKYKGKVVVVANVASKCGSTNTNYTQLKNLLDKHKAQGLELALFPCNQFELQEPGSNAEIKKFVEEEFNFMPDLYAKIDVNGDNADPLFKFLKEEKHGSVIDAIKWNFTKFLIDKDGNVVKRYAPTTEPKEMLPDIEKLIHQMPQQ